MNKRENLLPFRQPCPVCDIVKRELEARGIDLKDFAWEMWGYPYGDRSSVEKRIVENIEDIGQMFFDNHPQFQINAELAFRLEQVLGITAEFWLNLQNNRDLWPFRKAAQVAAS